MGARELLCERASDGSTGLSPAAEGLSVEPANTSRVQRSHDREQRPGEHGVIQGMTREKDQDLHQQQAAVDLDEGG